MKLHHATALALAAASAVTLGPTAGYAASPPASSSPPNSCFYRRNIESWTAVDRRTVNLRVNLHDYYQLKLATECTDIDFSQRIGIETRGSNWICSGLDVTVISPGPGGPQRCMGLSLRKLTPAEAAALPPRDRP